MHELLSPASLSASEALERCHVYLAESWKRWRLARIALPPEVGSDLVALLAWHALVRELDRSRDEDARLEALDTLGRTIVEIFDGQPRTAIGLALRPTVRHHALSALSLRGPLEERRRTRYVKAFGTRAELQQHARKLAQPEGRVYLRILGRSAERDEVLVDALSLGLQLIDWLARLRADLARGQLHVAVEDLARHDIDILAFREGGAVERARRLVADQVAWARGLLAKGWPLCRELGRWRGRELAFVLRWHAATLSALEARHFDAFAGPPPAGWPRLLACGSASLVTLDAPRLT